MNTKRYIRQITLEQVGTTGQQKLQSASVLVIGAGGLGCAVLPYLVASGIGNIGIVDGDVVDITNLHRQVLYNHKDIDKAKATVASLKLKAQNPETIITPYVTFLDGNNALTLIKNYDVIVDATDRISARYLINDACVLLDKPFVHASIHKFQIQLSVFNYNNGPTYRCLYPVAQTGAVSCEEGGVLGTTVAIAGAMQSNEVLKIILGIATVFSGQLMIIDALTNTQSIFQFDKNNTIKITQDSFEKAHQFEEVEYAFAKAENYQLIDVREAEEKPQLVHKNITQMPLSTFDNDCIHLDPSQEIALFCQSGVRSKQAFNTLKAKGFQKVKILNENAAQLKTILNE